MRRRGRGWCAHGARTCSAWTRVLPCAATAAFGDFAAAVCAADVVFRAVTAVARVFLAAVAGAVGAFVARRSLTVLRERVVDVGVGEVPERRDAACGLNAQS